jgi:hypothetical protein
MNSFTRSPLWDNWFETGRVTDSLIICSPYFKKNALDQIIKYFKLDDEYCNIKVSILIRGRLKDFIDGSSDLTALDALLNLKCIDIGNVRRLTNLHMKAFLKDNKNLLVGSGNCTYSGLFANNFSGNVEGGIQTDDQVLIVNFQSYFLEIFDCAEPLESFYDTISNEYLKNALIPAPPQKDAAIIDQTEKYARYCFTNDTANDFKGRDSNCKQKSYISEISAEDIPQVSRFSYVINDVLQILLEAEKNNEELTFITLGERIPNQKSEKEGAKLKYGENHSKAAEMLQLAAIIPEKTRKIFLTSLGRSYIHASQEEKKSILIKQLLQSNIVRDISQKYSVEGTFKIDDYLGEFLAKSTIERRRSSVKGFFKQLEILGNEEAKEILAAIF